MSAPHLVIFDCDGVLVDSERLAVDLAVRVFARFGLSYTREEVISEFVGRSEGLIQETIEASLGRPLSDADNRRVTSLYVEEYERLLVPVRGIAEALAAIPYPMCVASGSKPESLVRKLEICGLLGWFDGRLFSSSQVAEGKPAPDLFLLAAKTMEVDPSRCIVVEDSLHGVIAARRAGMRCLAYVGGMIAPDLLTGPGTVLFEDMLELPALIAAAARAQDSGIHS